MYNGNKNGLDKGGKKLLGKMTDRQRLGMSFETAVSELRKSFGDGVPDYDAVAKWVTDRVSDSLGGQVDCEACADLSGSLWRALYFVGR